ncbi:uncharacterized protein CIMG_13143 [Coccidioides immitis RS]|uniref:Uncharacterized protein n=1 Tax=Coccidioides immitis (strain RS) TaxID=246410 RepID=J3KA79_COCIM|nr:uncharacterized protein CIMG_13143 [Coccidioides immitis RS]EAS31900.3 hypothetical protein CIMG_13143 [Coccidioides immitis RS]
MHSKNIEAMFFSQKEKCLEDRLQHRNWSAIQKQNQYYARTIEDIKIVIEKSTYNCLHLYLFSHRKRRAGEVKNQELLQVMLDGSDEQMILSQQATKGSGPPWDDASTNSSKSFMGKEVFRWLRITTSINSIKSYESPRSQRLTSCC